MTYRRYLARRDVSVRAWRDQVLALRHNWSRQKSLARPIQRMLAQAVGLLEAWRAGRQAAREMWRATRHARTASPNLLLLDQDRLQLEAWCAWLRQCHVEPAHVMTANPVVADWLLTFTVWNFAPAVQRIVVEQKAGGAWQVIKSCHTIEFTSRGAAPRSSLKHAYAAPVSGFANHRSPLRLVISGVGRVRISALRLTDGVTAWKATLAKPWVELGHTPAAGWPQPGRATVWELKFKRI